MTEIAKAYVQIVPTTQGIASSLKQTLGAEVDAAGDSAGKSWTSKFAGAAKGAMATVGVGIAAAGAAAVAVGKQALEAYGDYEQLTGGIETLYGSSADAVQKMLGQADSAWKTAGISANEYMETAISSSAAMISSLGGDADKAAELMDMSIIDMSDNVNKMGTTMETVQNAYRGFSRGNFTMLDNLSLGFAGTKEGMQQLLDKAEELAGVEFNIDSYSDIVQAIHVVQESMGIAGTTAKEASETIQGSVNAAKAAWKNLLVGIADDNADFDKLIDNFVDSVVTASKNILPRVQSIIKGLSKLITEAAKKLLPIVIQAITENLPALVSAGVQLIAALVTGLMQAIPQIIEAIPDILAALVDGLKESWPQLKEAGAQALEAIALGLAEATWMLWTAVGDGLADLFTQIDDAVAREAQWEQEKLLEIAGNIATGLDKLNQDMANWLAEAVDTVSQKLEEAATAIKTWFDQRVDAVKEFVQTVVDRVTEFYRDIKSKVEEAMKWIYDHTIGKLVEVVEGIKEKLNAIRQHFQDLVDAAYVWGQDLIVNFADGIAKMMPHLAKAVNWAAEKVSNLLGFSEPKEGPLSNFHTYAPDMMKLFAQGIRDNERLVTDQLRSSFDFGKTVFISTGAAAGNTSNTYNITVNGIEELEELLQWYESRQVRARMA